jgi:hypothetical protein
MNQIDADKNKKAATKRRKQHKMFFAALVLFVPPFGSSSLTRVYLC